MNRTLPRLKPRVINKQPSSGVNIMDTESIDNQHDYTETVTELYEDVPQLVRAQEITESAKEVDQKHEFYSVAQARQRRRLVPRIQNEDGRNDRVGWIDTCGKKIICHSCYDKNHISPQCQLKWFQLDQVVKNYELLTLDERAMVPDNSYNNSKSYLAINESNTREVGNNQRTETKK